MEEGECPSIITPDDLHTLNTANRSIGSVVHVFCHNVTVAILKCLTEQKWNATKPTCLQGATSTLKPTLHLNNNEEMKVETIIIIVWVLGGILLFSLLVLLTVILTSRHKGGVRRPTRRTSIFTVAAETRRGGGDNPAFSTENEHSNWSLHRNTERLPPSYREAMMDRPPRLEATRSQPSTSTATTNAQPQVSTSTARSATSSGSQEDGSRRYTQEYPSCFWEEEPPPPYSLFADTRPSSDRIINIERTQSNRMTIAQSPRPTRRSSNCASASGQSDEQQRPNPSMNHRTIVNCSVPSNVPSLSRTTPQSQEQERPHNQSSRSTAHAEVHQPSRPSTHQIEASRRPSSSHRREQPVASPQTTRNPIISGALTPQYRCSRIEATAPLARLEIEYV